MSKPRKHPDGTNWTVFDYARSAEWWARAAFVVAASTYVVALILLAIAVTA